MGAKNGRIRLALGSARTTDPFLGLAHLIQGVDRRDRSPWGQ